MAELLQNPTIQFFDANGDPLSGGLLYSYEAGTVTPKALYTDLAGSSAHTNPIVLNSRGEAANDIRMASGSYKIVLKDSNEVTIWTRDNVQSFADIISTEGALAVANNLSDLASVPTALTNLGIAPLTVQTQHDITGGQSATDLTDETFDADDYSMVVHECTIIRGTTIVDFFTVICRNVNGTWNTTQGPSMAGSHGITITNSQTDTVGQLRAAATAGDNGTLLIKKHYYTKPTA